jgi:ribosomal protein L29
MAGQVPVSTPEELHRAIRDIERELSRLDVILADRYAERSRLIRELRRLCAQLRDAKDAALSITEPLLG